LRAEVAAGNERLARQAAYFMEEMRRLGGTVPATGPARRAATVAEPAAKRPLVERINDPRVARLVRAGDETQTKNPRRVSGFLKALDGDGASPEKPDAEKPDAAAAADPVPEAAPAAPSADEAAKASEGRKPRLLERITGLDKTSA
jgi:hypothetical protein